jgi:hypothetical protein
VHVDFVFVVDQFERRSRVVLWADAPGGGRELADAIPVGMKREDDGLLGSSGS